ncbi:MAG: transcriptional repressor LexA [Proteobacteria bacterium]|nr:transcriptional repressor LexA [Pseudomonadota bacterium]
MLTRKQYELLMFIDASLKKNGVSPSFDEMKEALDLKSKSGIHRLITGLEERGFIRRLPHRARALEVVKLPENMAPATASAVAAASAATGVVQGPRPVTSSPFRPNVIDGGFMMQGAVIVAEAADAVQLPLYGRIAAGTPIEALRDHSTFVDVPAMFLDSGEHYALEVDGDSMIDAGIFDGDTVIIKRSDTAENGSIVVALVEDNEVTLKRLRRKGASIALEPANKSYETRIFGPDQVKVQGTLTGLLRRY